MIDEDGDRGTPRAVMAEPNDTLFDGPGEMAAHCRAFDWAATPLGPVAGWSQSLRTTVRLLLASRHPMFLWWGPDLVQIYNDAYRPSLGHGGRHPRALGMRAAEFWTDIWPIIGPQIEGVMTRGEATWHEDALVPIERNGRLEDVYWTYGYSPAFDDDGTVGGTLVVCTETTRRMRATAERERAVAAERRARADADEARAALARIFDEAPVAIAVLRGRELRYIQANPRYRQIIGGRDPVGRRLVELFPDLAGSEIEAVLERVHDSGVPFVANDLLVRFDSQGAGEIDNYYDLVYQPTATGADSSRDIVVIAVDVTDRRRSLHERERLLDAAERARAEAELANRAKSDFLAVMSHELRTPLNAIGGYTQLIELGIHGPVTPAQRDALCRIQRSQRHLLGLINGVLNYARVEAGAVYYEITDVSVDEVLATAEALTAPQATAKRIELSFAGCAPEIRARADREKLQQIVLNLLSNALKFTPLGGAVRLSCVPSGAHVVIRVADTGCGIAAAELEHVFQAFVQLDARLTRTQEGTGLGLSISRDLAHGMGGDLTVDSVVGEGSTFTLTLPLA